MVYAISTSSVSYTAGVLVLLLGRSFRCSTSRMNLGTSPWLQAIGAALLVVDAMAPPMGFVPMDAGKMHGEVLGGEKDLA